MSIWIVFCEKKSIPINIIPAVNTSMIIGNRKFLIL